MQVFEGYNNEIEEWAKRYFSKQFRKDSSDAIPLKLCLQTSLPYLRYCAYMKFTPDTYLDHAGITVYPSILIENCMKFFLEEFCFNPHTSENTANSIEEIRLSLLRFLGANPDEYSLVFTSGSTQSLSIIAQNFPFTLNSNFAYTLDSHTSVLGIREYALSKGSNLICLPLNNNKDGWMELLKTKECPTFQENEENPPKPSLLAISGESNWNGIRPDYNNLKEFLRLNRKIKSRWITLLDASRLYSSYELNLTELPFDFVVVSFYKIFGFPTGIGALLIHHSSSKLLEPRYFGGGTILTASALSDYHIKKLDIISSLEAGTPNFQSIFCLPLAIKYVYEPFTKQQIFDHISSITRYAFNEMDNLYHRSVNPHLKLCRIFGHHRNPPYPNSQGPTIAFLINYNDGSIISPSYVNDIAISWKIILRVGCHCNLGACQNNLLLTDQDIKAYYRRGYKCGGSTDVIDGQPLGCLRISFGSSTTVKDIKRFILFLKVNFLEKVNPISQPNISRNLRDIGERTLIESGCIIHIAKPNAAELKISSTNTEKTTAHENVNSSANTETDSRKQISIPYNFELQTELDITTTRGSLLKSQTIASTSNIPSDSELHLTHLGINMKNICDKFNITPSIKFILIYPIKGCRGLNVPSWPILSNGLLWDRQFAIFRNNRVLTTSSYPELVLLSYIILIPVNISHLETCTHVKMSTNNLPIIRIFTPNKPEHNYLDIPLSTDKEWIDICNSPEFTLSLLNAYKFPKNFKIKEYLSDGSINFVTEADMKFNTFSNIKFDTMKDFHNTYNSPSLHLYESHDLQVERHITDLTLSGSICELRYSKIKHYNTQPFLLINQNSLEFLSQKLEMPLEIERFRPNFVITGFKPFEEYNYLKFCIGGINFTCKGECIRCKSINVDYINGNVNNSILRGLATFHKSCKTTGSCKPKMGILLDLENTVSCINDKKSDKIYHTIWIDQSVFVSEPHNPYLDSNNV